MIWVFFCLCQMGTDYAAAVDGVWKDDLVVRFLPLSFYAKKKVAERKARIRGIAPRSASLLFGAAVRIAQQFLRMSFAHAPPLYIPLMTAQPIAT